MFLDNALVLDPQTGRCDLGFDGTDLMLDATVATPMLISMGCNRRARSDDVLPIVESDFYVPGSLMARQGWVGDALDFTGQLIGSRLWLLDGAKATRKSKQLGESATLEALGHFQNSGLSVGVKVGYTQRQVLGIQAVVANTKMTVTKALS
jgi:phage gp46-like protein